MCIIMFKKSGTHLPEDKWRGWIENMESNNNDGNGIMYYINDAVYWKKGMDLNLKDEIKSLQRTYGKSLRKVHLGVHCRISTSAGISSEMCHPFFISPYKADLKKKSGKTVQGMCLMHNGVISGYGDNKNGLSDTAHFVRKTIGQIGMDAVENKGIRKLIGDAIDGDKFLILATNGTAYHWGNWKEEDGIMFSNNGYSYKTACYDDGYYRYGMYNTSTKKKEHVWDKDAELIDMWAEAQEIKNDIEWCEEQIALPYHRRSKEKFNNRELKEMIEANKKDYNEAVQAAEEAFSNTCKDEDPF